MHATAPDGHASPISDDGCEPPGLSPHARTGPPWPSVQANDCAEPPRLSAHACAGPLGPSAQADGSAEPPRLSALACTGPPRPSVQADDGAEPTRLQLCRASEASAPPGETMGTGGRSTRPGCTTAASTGSAATLCRPFSAAASREAASCQATEKPAMVRAHTRMAQTARWPHQRNAAMPHMQWKGRPVAHAWRKPCQHAGRTRKHGTSGQAAPRTQRKQPITPSGEAERRRHRAASLPWQPAHQRGVRPPAEPILKPPSEAERHRRSAASSPPQPARQRSVRS